MRGIAVCVLMLTLSLWTVQQGKALPWKQQKTYSSSQFPQHRLLQKTPHFEYRRYEPSTLISKQVPANSSINDLFDTLTNLRYFQVTHPIAGVLEVDRLNAIHGVKCVEFGGMCGHWDHCQMGERNDKPFCQILDSTIPSSYPYKRLAHRDCSYEHLTIYDPDGYRCVFPFKYDGIWFHACTSYRMRYPYQWQWCAHRTYYHDGYGEWGYCPFIKLKKSAIPPCVPGVVYWGELPKLSVAYVLPREMEAEALASSPGNDVTVTPVPAGNFCSRDMETADMTDEKILATASELVKHCQQAGHNHTEISLVKYLNRDEPRAEMWYM